MSQILTNGCIAATPPGRTGHVCVAYEKYIFVWGGYKENPGSYTNTYFSGSEIWMYNCISEKWFLKEPCALPSTEPPGMSGSAAVIIKDALYLFGGYGYSGEGCTNRLYKLDLLTFRWEEMTPTGAPPIPVDKMVGWQYKDKFYVFGGFGNPDSGPSHDFQFVFYHLLWRGWTNQFFEYDPASNQWNKPVSTGDPPSARAAHAAAVLCGKVYIFGGRHGMYRLNDLHCLDMEKMAWSGEISVKGPVPEGRSWHSLTALMDDYLILYGGFSQNNIALSDCWMFNTNTQTWQPIELPYQKPRVWHCACLTIYNEVLIYGGCKSNILDLARAPDQATDTIVIRISPKSLFRLSVDKLLEYPQLSWMWSWLPHSVQTVLRLRLGNVLSRNVDGS